ncbi:MAG: hypothetical protein SFU98_02005 [Leptospiraceae bacterium]|nr:hypothetical protein [Leptospiraceae bacterium]
MKLFLADVILKWPEVTGTTLIYLIVIIGISLFFWILVKTIAKNELIEKQSWSKVLQIAYRHKLTLEEVKLLSSFFEQEKLSPQQDLSIITDRRKLHAIVSKNLALKNSQSAETEICVNIYDKLFHEKEYHLEIYSLNDIHENEVCSVESKSKVYLGKVIQVTSSNLLIHIDGFKRGSIKVQEEISIYFYRIGLGGYLMKGKLLGSETDSIFFAFTGEIEFKGENHMKAPYKYKLELQGTSSDVKRTPTNIPIESMEISDRWISFNFEDANFDPTKFLENWTIELTFSGEVIALKGKLIAPHNKNEFYSLKFYSQTDDEKKLLLANIKKLLSKNLK